MKLVKSTGKRVFIIAVAALICLLIVGFGLTTTKIIDLPFLNNIISQIIVPLQRNITEGIQSFTLSIEQRKTQMELTEEIDELMEENKILQASLAQMDELTLENQRLRELLGTRSSMPEYTFISATVSGKEPGGWFETFTLNVGSENGVTKNDPVMTNDGLVGRVVEVYDETCVVMSIIDSRSAASGIVERTRDNGIVCGSLYLTDKDEYLQMQYLPDTAELTSGDRVITSGLDGLYPKGLFIGEVRSISRDSAEKDRYVVVDAAVDFNHIEDVLVMLLGGEQKAAV